MRRPGLLAAMCCLALLALAGCSSNDNDEDGAATATAEAAATGEDRGDGNGLAGVTNEDLAVLVLPQAELATLAEGMEVDPESGYTDNALYAENSLDPEDTGADVGAAGRLTGYGLTYTVEDPFQVLSAGEGLISAGSQVERFASGDGASAHIEKRLADFERLAGETIDSITISGVSRFDVEEVGDEAGGLRFVGSIAGLESGFHVTLMFTRMGPLLGTVQAQAADDEDLSGPLREALVKLEERVERLAAGELDEEPVPLPTPVPEGDGATLPEGVVDVAPAALILEDLPPGFTVTGEEYATDGSADFTRTFEAQDGISAAIGSTDVVQLENNVILFGSAAEATAFVTVITSLLTGPDGAEFFGGLLEEEGIEGEPNLESREIAVGDGGVVIEGPVDTGLLTIQLAFVVGRQAEGVSVLIITGLPEGFTPDDFIPLLETSIDRLSELPRE